MKKNKSIIILIFAIAFLTVSVSLFTFPEVSKRTAKNDAKRKSETFDNTVQDLQEEGNYHDAVKNGKITEKGHPIDEDTGEVIYEYSYVYQQDIDKLYNDSVNYNNSLKERQDLNIDFSTAALELTNYGIWDGIFGYIRIPSIDLIVPIYLGSSVNNMSIGVTHLMNTSLPIGGVGTNSVIAGHTGYIGRTFFDSLPNLHVGDTIYVTNFWGTMEYSVVSSKVIGATDTNDCYIQKEKDLLTLMTCTNAGRERYQVQCERIN